MIMKIQNKKAPYQKGLARKIASRIYTINIITATIIAIIIGGCKKDFLETRSNRALLVPETLTDFQRILDNTGVMNLGPSIPLISGDEFYADQNTVSAWSTPAERNAFTWADDIFEGQTSSDWNTSYKQVFCSNIILDGMEKMGEAEKNTTGANAIKGAALFFRAVAFYNLAQEFCAPYRQNGNDQLLGLPLKLRSDINEKVQRSTLTETYAQIISDLKTSVSLLPPTTTYKNRPTSNAATAMLARVAMSMQDYPEALRHADNSLKQNNKLLDFNSLMATLTSTANPFPTGLPLGNEEVLFYSTLIGYSFFNNNFRVDNLLYNSYAANDLRKSTFFADRGNGQITIKGTYGGTTGAFIGLANDELYLIRAECQARLGNLDASMSDLNQLLIKRHRTGTYQNISANTPEEALIMILSERQKELIRRGVRWTDLRRLNQQSSTAKVLQHILGAKTYTLEPASPKYTMPIPPDEIIASGIIQNPR